MARFDTRLTKSQKELFEQASLLGGYKTLSDFILASAQEQADRIIKRHRKILETEQDRNTFFNALLHPGKPNAELKRAAARYLNAMPKK